MKFLSGADTEDVFDWDAAVDCIRAAYAAEHAPKAVPGRLVAADRSAWIRCMPAIPAGGRYMGSKQIVRTRSGKVTYLITLYDTESGSLSYVIDGISITSMRTAATSAVALDRLSPREELKVGLIGSGLEARMHASVICKRHKVGELAVHSPTRANRERLAAELQASYGVPARAVETGEEAVRGANCIVTAARSRDESPLLYADWIAPGTVVISVGSTTPTQREIDVSVIDRAALIVADIPDELAHDTGDMRAATEAGIGFSDKLISLQTLVRDGVGRAGGDGDVRMFKSVGSAIQDIAFAEMIATASEKKGLGVELDVELSTKQSIGRNS